MSETPPERAAFRANRIVIAIFLFAIMMWGVIAVSLSHGREWWS